MEAIKKKMQAMRAEKENVSAQSQIAVHKKKVESERVCHQRKTNKINKWFISSF